MRILNSRIDLASLLVVLAAAVLLASCDRGEVKNLIIEDIVVGEGEPAANPQQVYVHYTGWLYDPGKEDGRGDKFDSSHDRGYPFSFPLGGGRVIKGWDEGVLGMKVGGVRVLTIPSEMAYGKMGGGRGRIPPDTPLVFEIERVPAE
jgi:FKBP-type peptidyl-prolyl cis-trans isomerase FkpA